MARRRVHTGPYHRHRGVEGNRLLLHSGLGRKDLRGPGGTSTRGGPHHWDHGTARHDRTRRRLPEPPGHRLGVPDQQPPPRAGHDRPTGLRPSADERAAHGTEHPRVRGGRGPTRVPQLGNREHIKELARLWNVDQLTIPDWAPPTHAMQIWRYAEQDSIEFMWIQCTNPAVSLPELHRIRDILKQENFFVVVQDIFLTETARLADVVLPAATWGEK